MDRITLIATATMGVESIVAQELKDLGYSDIKTFNGRVEYEADLKDIPVSNIFLRCADRVYIKMGEFKATSFEELFEKTKKLPWSEILPSNAEFPVSWISSVKSELFSKSDCQKIVKKAVVENLKKVYGHEYFPEDGALYRIKVQINNDVVIISIDTSGEPLHKRGYRSDNNDAPIKETLAAAMVKLSRWKGGERAFMDPMCGTGTIPIEAAMIARNIAPGANRRFAAEEWHVISEKLWLDARDLAYSKEDYSTNCDIYASDIDGDVLELAKRNAATAGVDDCIKFEKKHILETEKPSEYGCLVTNPPYGERLLDSDSAERLYRQLGDICSMRLPKWSYYVITSNEKFQENFGKKANKNRKLYNGGLKCYYYQYYGEKPKNK